MYNASKKELISKKDKVKRTNITKNYKFDKNRITPII